MTQEQKELLLKDLCSRLPYGVKVYGNYSYNDGDKIVDDIKTKVLDIYDIDWVINNIEIKPYLFPISSMTEEQKNEYQELCESTPIYSYYYGIKTLCSYEYKDTLHSIDWLVENHFDYRGLIPMGLAKDATGLNIY